MNRRQLKDHISPQDTNYYLMRLGLLGKRDIKPRTIEPEQVPQPLHRSPWTGKWFTIDARNVSDDELARFLDVRRAHAYVRRNYALIAGIVAAILIASTWLETLS